MPTAQYWQNKEDSELRDIIAIEGGKRGAARALEALAQLDEEQTAEALNQRLEEDDRLRAVAKEEADDDGNTDDGWDKNDSTVNGWLN